MFQTKVVEESNKRFEFNNVFPRKSCRLWENAEKYFRAVHATENNMAHAHCMLANLNLQTHSQYVIQGDTRESDGFQKKSTR